jgi:Protein of unknown function (DUF2975)
MNVSKKLVTASRIMAWLSLAGIVIVPLVTVVGFLDPDATTALSIRFGHLGAPLTSAVPLTNRIGALLCEIIPVAIVVWGLTALTRLFRLFAKGNVFSTASLRALNQVAAALFWNVLAAFVVQAPISYFLTAANPPGQRAISLGLGSDDIEVLFLAGVAVVIARVMAEAHRMADENASFV